MRKSTLSLCITASLACQEVLIRDSRHPAAKLTSILADHLRPILLKDPQLRAILTLSYELPILQTSVIQLCLQKSDSTSAPTDLPADDLLDTKSSDGTDDTLSEWIIDEGDDDDGVDDETNTGSASGSTRLYHSRASDSLQSVDEAEEETLVKQLIADVRPVFEVVELSTSEKDLVDVDHRHWFR